MRQWADKLSLLRRAYRLVKVELFGFMRRPVVGPDKGAASLPDHWEVKVERKAYRKRLLLQVKPSGQIVISTLMGTSKRQINQFLLEHQNWIERQLQSCELLRQRYPKIEFVDGDYIPFLGRKYRVQFVAGKKIAFEFNGDDLLVRLHPRFFQLPESKRYEYRKKLFQTFFKKRARKTMQQRVLQIAARMQLTPSRITFRGQTSMWGSCSYKGAISLNWKLMIFPAEIVDYVITHELAHLVHRNHSKDFWQLVGQFDSDWKRHRKFLSEHQHSVDFLAKTSELYPELNINLRD